MLASEVHLRTRSVIRYLTRTEKKDLIHRYGSIKALSEFRVDLPQDYDPDWLQDITLREGVMQDQHYGEVLDEADLLGDSDEDQETIFGGPSFKHQLHTFFKQAVRISSSSSRARPVAPAAPVDSTLLSAGGVAIVVGLDGL
jgi:hypothetical protein